MNSLSNITKEEIGILKDTNDFLKLLQGQGLLFTIINTIKTIAIKEMLGDITEREIKQNGKDKFRERLRIF
jgi:hypothetical protein